MSLHLSPLDKNFGSQIFEIIKENISSEFMIEVKTKTKKPSPCPCTIEFTVREKTEKEKRAEKRINELENKIKKLI